MPNPTNIQEFINRWANSGAVERANFQQFAVELCDIIDVPHPDPSTPIEANNAYVFERSVSLPHGATGRVDLYKRGCFVLEAKQGSDPNEERPQRFQKPLRSDARRKKGARRARVEELLETLSALGQIRRDGDRFVGQ